MTSTAIQRARTRLLTGALSTLGSEGGVEQQRPGTITIGSTTYEAAVALMAIEHRMSTDTGLWMKIQPMKVFVRKTLLTTSPPKRTILTFAGNDYQVDDVAGQNANDLAWVIRAERLLPSPT